jgi:hypothetical protein
VDEQAHQPGRRGSGAAWVEYDLGASARRKPRGVGRGRDDGTWHGTNLGSRSVAAQAIRGSYSRAVDPETVVRRYLKVFETADLAEMEALVAEDVEIWGAGNHVVGRRHPLSSVLIPV